MAQLRLAVYQMQHADLFPQSYLDERGTARELPWLRLRVSLVVGRDDMYTPDEPNRYDPIRDDRPIATALFDSGATITVFPKAIWQPFESEITRLDLNPDELVRRRPDQRTPTGLVGGGSYPYFLGRVWVGAFDFWMRRMPAIPIMARFRLDDPIHEVPTLLGLWGGILQGRRFWQEWTTEDIDPDLPATVPANCRRNFGQRWWLSDW